MGKTNSKEQFKADTTLMEKFNEILPLLQKAGWDFDFVRINQGHGKDIFRYGVLTRDIKNPVCNTGKSYPQLARKHNSKQELTPNAEQAKPASRLEYRDFENTGSQKSGYRIDNQVDEESPICGNPHGYQLSLFQTYPQSARKTPLRADDTTTTEFQKSAQGLGLQGVKDNGVVIPYGKERCPKGSSDPAGEMKALVPSVENQIVEVKSISRMRLDKNSVSIAIDTEFFSIGDERYILTWQFAFSDTDPSIIHEVVFFSVNGERLSIQTALSWIVDKYKLYALPFVVKGNNKNYPVDNGFRISNTRRWKVPVSDDNGDVKNVVCYSFDEAVSKCTDANYRKRLISSTKTTSDGKRIYHKLDETKRNDVGYYNAYGDYNKYAIPVTLLFHTAIADLTGFDTKDSEFDPLLYVSSVNGGLVSLKGNYIYLTRLDKYWCFRPVFYDIRDIMCLAPSKKRLLSVLGDAIGVPKRELLPGYSKDDMCRYLAEQPVEFLEYAINDSVVTLCYASELWGDNKRMPATLPAAAVKASLPIIKKYFGCNDNDVDKFNLLYRGLVRVPQGLVKKVHKGKVVYSDSSSLEPVNYAAGQLIDAAKACYKGGYNGSVEVGWFDERMTYDYDLINAYATSMALCFDVDWTSDKLILREWKNERITRFDFRTPADPIFGCFKFEFPENVKFPCIPVTVNGSIVYPRKYDGANDLDGVYACGPEVYLALLLGAKVTACYAVQGIYRSNEDGTASQSLRSVVRDFVNDRIAAQKIYGKGSLLEVLIKEALNALYGKVAQGVKEKNSWNAYMELMQKIGGSDITSPVHASIITSLVRACLLATMNQLSNMGYHIYSVTTDGFISDAPFDVVKHLDLYGFRSFFQSVRYDLTGEYDMWQMKHAQKGLLNFSTRGNVALNDKSHPVIVDGVPYAGVCAHNSFVTGMEKESYEDRLSLVKTVLSRTSRCKCNVKTFAKFREVSRRNNRLDFYVDEEEHNISMDFDMKRKPVFESFETVQPVVDGVPYEIANFTTRPYEDVEEFKLYKEASVNFIRSGCLLTVNDWQKFFVRMSDIQSDVHNNDSDTQKKIVGKRCPTRRITDMDWSRIVTLVMGHRLGYWVVPYLAGNYTVDEKIAYINSLNKSEKKFTLLNWKNCRRPERASQMLPIEMMSEMFAEAGVTVELKDDTVSYDVKTIAV